MNKTIKQIILLSGFAFVMLAFTEGKGKENTHLTLNLGAEEEFIFGEFTDKNAKIKMHNTSDQELRVKIVDEVTGEPQAQYDLLPGDTFMVAIPAWEKCMIQNPTDKEVSLVVTSKQLYTGYRIQEIGL